MLGKPYNLYKLTSYQITFLCTAVMTIDDEDNSSFFL